MHCSVSKDHATAIAGCTKYMLLISDISLSMKKRAYINWYTDNLCKHLDYILMNELLKRRATWRSIGIQCWVPNS